MALLIVSPKMELTQWIDHIRMLAPDIDLRIWPDVGDPRDIMFGFAHKPPAGVWKPFLNLKGIACMGVGVDHILSDPDFPMEVPLARIVDPTMANFMGEYIVLAVLSHCRNYGFYIKNQAESRWDRRVPLLAAETPVGIMGMGQLGSLAAEKLMCFDFPILGWSREPKRMGKITGFAGQNELASFLSQSRILVCLLPLTPETRGILNNDTFSKLPKGAYIINAARGEHLVESDLLDALDSDHLAGACLDVFQMEPLPGNHPYWHHPKIVITPHIASLILPKNLIPQLLGNYRRALAGKTLKNLVDPKRGY